MDVRRFTTLVLLLLATTLAACGPADIVTYIPEGGSYAAEDLGELLASADLGDSARIDVADAADVRQRALAELRKSGDDAALLADTLTADFPADVAAVPVSVEKATYEGDAVWIVTEAAADDAGTLSYRRLWVFSYDERAVLAARSAR